MSTRNGQNTMKKKASLSIKVKTGLQYDKLTTEMTKIYAKELQKGLLGYQRHTQNGNLFVCNHNIGY